MFLSAGYTALLQGYRKKNKPPDIERNTLNSVGEGAIDEKGKRKKNQYTWIEPNPANNNC